MRNSTLFQSVTLVCEEDSWISPYIEKLDERLRAIGIASSIVKRYVDIEEADAAFFLGCTSVCPKKYLNRNLHNFVVHESDLPKGRGFAPISWGILENHDTLFFSLIEASEQVDAGKIYSQHCIPLRGNELCAEIRDLQGTNTIKICFDFIMHGSLAGAIDQKGEPTYNRRRIPADSELDIDMSIADQFNLLRVVDNEKYPAFFKFKGRKYRLKIEDLGPTDD